MTLPLAIILSLFIASPVVTEAQTPVSDLPALERQLDRAREAVARERLRLQPDQRADLDAELRVAEDEVAYLRVRTRRGETVSDRDRREVSDRIDRLLHRVGSVLSHERSSAGDARAIPAGTELDVRLQSGLSSKTAKVEQRVTATTMVDLYRGDQLVIPAGARVEGHVVSVEPASRLNRRGSLGLRFDRVTFSGRTEEVRLSVTQALESDGLKGEVDKIGAGASVGAIIGGILGGVRGAIAGMVIGGGGVVLATEGSDVDLPAGTVLRLRFDSDFSTVR